MIFNSYDDGKIDYCLKSYEGSNGNIYPFDFLEVNNRRTKDWISKENSDYGYCFRYGDIHLIRSTRVELQSKRFIHANFINFDKIKNLIATQVINPIYIKYIPNNQGNNC